MGGCDPSFTNEFRRCRIIRPNTNVGPLHREAPSLYDLLENVIGTSAGDVVELAYHVR